MSFDEETGEEITCPYCDASGGCEHHLLTVDTTFGEVLGGFAYEKFSDLIALVEQEFDRLLAYDGPSPTWDSWTLSELWQQTVDNSEEGETPYVDGAALASFLIEILEEAGAVRLDGVCDEWVGQSSAYAHLYTESPSAVVAKSFAAARKLLATSGQVARG